MVSDVSMDAIGQVNKFIEEKFGLYFSSERLNDLIRCLANAAKEKNINLNKYVNRILLNKISSEEISDLAIHLTIGETYFFRDKKIFEILKQKILPQIIKNRIYNNRTLKIWSAGCSSGEEAYSIAILVRELIPDYEKWNIKIIATDINKGFIKKAQKGIYSDWSFRGLGVDFKNKYFDIINNNRYALKNDILKLVEFKYLNLADNNYVLDNVAIDNIDIIFCRNVLMYFSSAQAKKIINRLYNIIASEGWMVIAPTESLYINETSFEPVNFNGTFLYNKKIHKDNSMVEAKNNPIIKKMPLITFNKSYTSLKSKTNRDIKTLNKLEIENEDELQKLSRKNANQGKLQEALHFCRKAIEKNRVNAVNYHLLANIEQERGNFEEAISSLKKAIYLDTSFIMAYFDLANLNLKQKNLKDASKNFKNALGLLDKFNEKQIVPWSAEMTSGGLKQIIKNIIHKERFNGEI